MVLTIHNNNPLPICRRSYPPCPIPPNAALRESFTIETVYRPPSATQRPIFIVRHLPSAVRRPHHRPPLNHWLCCPCSFASLHLSSLIWPLCLQEHPSICWLLCCIITPITLLVAAFGLPSSRRIRLLVLCLPGALASSLSLHPFRSLAWPPFPSHRAPPSPVWLFVSSAVASKSPLIIAFPSFVVV
jgi:hypothetical protein